MIVRLNGLMGITLQPGDHLTLQPLDFSIVVDISDKTVTLRRKVGEKEHFFKEYLAADIRVPSGMKAPAEMEIKGKSAVADGKSVLSTDPRYVDAEKWLPASRTGIVMRSPPAATPSPVAALVETVVQESGVFLDRSDLEELFALVRNGSKLYFVR
jgi:hypothetical protein